ncbi:GNAT family N-acetyltransferase [Proteiniclasticum sp. C24MP]|uniref:GNAT family N-acetyltransferase n=1 Tax=Proteiniclasticum sp. C24MP TaxID=3374101 RepID=UPI00375526EC
MNYFESERLLFRDWQEEDLKIFREMNLDPLVMQYFPKTLTEEETDLFHQRIQEEFRRLGFGLYAVEVKETGTFIGYIGFHEAAFPAPFTPCIEIGWRLSASAWGRGYATEGAKACLQYGFTELNLNEVYSFTAEINLPSENVMRKIGMTKIMEFDHPSVKRSSPLKKHVLYLSRNPDL